MNTNQPISEPADCESPLEDVIPILDRAEDLLHLADTCESDDPFHTVPVKSTHERSRFQILRPLGKGGLGIVSVARDEELEREVALKEIQPRLADDPESRDRFEREAKITGALEHPGIVPVYGLGARGNGRLYYAMRLIRGESLKEAIERSFQTFPATGCQERAAELRKLLNRFVDACNAVAYAHSRHVVHRDIKPDNIMLGRYGETLVVDWGLAKPLDQVEPRRTVVAAKTCEGPLRLTTGSSTATRMGSMLGTPQFMSPEQAEGRLDQAGPKSDIYSLGATLYFLLTGRTPFECTELHEILSRVRSGTYPTPRQVRCDVAAPLEAICLKAMALDPSDRYESAGDLAEEIECWLGDEPVAAYTESWRQRVARWSRRHRAWTQAGAIALAAVAITGMIATAIVAQAWHEEDLEHDQTMCARREAELAQYLAEQVQSKLASQIRPLGFEEAWWRDDVDPLERYQALLRFARERPMWDREPRKE